jgi:hypothetical protein
MEEIRTEWKERAEAPKGMRGKKTKWTVKTKYCRKREKCGIQK